MKIKVAFLAWFVFGVMGLSCLMARSQLVRFDVLVLDEDSGEPIPDISVSAYFTDIPTFWGGKTVDRYSREKTDKEGICKFRGTSNAERAGYRVSRIEGFYNPSSWAYCRGNDDAGYGCVSTTVLQRVKHPIPLIAKRVGDSVKPSRVGFVDGTNTLFRYDFIKGDYLPPDGVGEVADMVVESRLLSLESMNDGYLTLNFFDFANMITFPGVGNGLVPHISRPTDGIKLRMASNGDYKPSTVIHCGRKRKDIPPNVYVKEFSETNPDRCYSFRIRSKFDEEGNLIEAYYGKVYGDFKIGSRLDGGCSVEFTYYLNPTSLDRNLECNCKTNLCTNPGRYLNLIP